ncbi:hypothetical protein AB3466_14270 [Sphingobacterium thalpophilum]|uniref:hypothetical protein n=1 Tax=Sphingobacterium thalpophilum TaxID=259 RepID=UPI0037DA1085
MKTLLTSIYFIVFLGFTMQSQAQTKEETIGWLKEKLSNNIMGRHNDPERFTEIRLMSVDEYKIVFVFKFKNYANEIKNMKEVLPVSISSIDENGHFKYSDKVCQTTYDGNTKFENMSWLTIAPLEENIRARIEKALKHLTSIRPKIQETF